MKHSIFLLMKYILVCNILENIYLQFYINPSLLGHFTTSTTFTLTILSNFWTLSNIPSIWILSTTYLICKFLYGPYVLLYIALCMLHGLYPSYTLFICWGVGIVLLSKSSCCFDTINTCSLSTISLWRISDMLNFQKNRHLKVQTTLKIRSIWCQNRSLTSLAQILYRSSIYLAILSDITFSIIFRFLFYLIWIWYQTDSISSSSIPFRPSACPGLEYRYI